MITRGGAGAPAPPLFLAPTRQKVKTMFENSPEFAAEVIRHACRALEPKNVRTLAALTELPYCTGMSAALAAEDIMDAEVAARRAGVRIIKGQKRYVGYLNNPNAL